MPRSIASPSRGYPHVSSMHVVGAYFPFVNARCHLTVDATIGDQAFTHDGCNIFAWLSYNKTNNTFLKSLRKNDIEAQVEFTLKIMERAWFTCY